MKAPSSNRYLVKSVLHAAKVLSAFQSPGEVLRLRDVVERTGFNKGLCFRFLYTLHECGFLEKIGENQYRLVPDLRRNRRYRIGYASQGQDAAFPGEVLASLTRAAEAEQVELIVVDNRYDPKISLRNAEKLVHERLDLVIEFQTDEAIAPAIGTMFMEAGLPFIAVDIPHPGAIFFGANNYQAGLIAGRHLGRWAKRNWGGEVDEILLVELSRAGSLPRTRVRAVPVGIREVLRLPESVATTVLDGDGQFRTTLEAVRRYLRGSQATRVLVGAANDPSALGALRAFEEAGRARHCAIVGQSAERDARAEMREPRTRLIGSVGYFPEKYGEGVMRLALDMLTHKPTAPAYFVRHQLITPENVDHYYPNDALTRRVWDWGLPSVLA